MDRHSVRRATRIAAFAFVLGGGLVAGAGQAGASPVCPEGSALTTVTDDFGNQVEACVASAPTAPAPTAVGTVGERRTAVAADALPETGSETITLLLATALVGAGSAASLVARRRSA